MCGSAASDDESHFFLFFFAFLSFLSFFLSFAMVLTSSGSTSH